MNNVESFGKNVEEAIQNGLKMLNATLDEVDVKIINEGGLFKKARVILTKTEPEPVKTENVLTAKETSVQPEEERKTVHASKSEQHAPQTSLHIVQTDKKDKPKAKRTQMEIISVIEPEGEVVFTSVEQSVKSIPRAKTGNSHEAKRPERIYEVKDFEPKEIEQVKVFLEGLLKELNIEAAVTAGESAEALILTLEGEKAHNIIGHRGECLAAVQTVVAAFLRNKDIRGKKVVINTGNYRERREDTLRSMARRMAKRAVESGRPVRMDPMNAYERRIVHDELNNNNEIITESAGAEPRRFITIKAKKNY